MIIPCHDDGEFLVDAVASVRESEPVELVVVDDGSTDPATRKALASLEARGLNVVRHETNRGVSAARMTGLGATSAPLVFCLDADDVLVEGRLGEMATQLESNPDARVCFGDYIEWAGDALLLRAVPDQLDPFRLAFTNEFPSAALFQRSLLEAAGGWRPLGARLDARSDWNLWLSIAELGVKGVHLGPGRATYMRRMHPERLSSLARDHQAELARRFRAAHRQTFEQLRHHRGQSRLPAWRKLLYPVVYRTGESLPIERRIKSVLDRLGVWTLQRDLPEVDRRSLLQSARQAHAGGVAMLTRGAPRVPTRASG